MTPSEQEQRFVGYMSHFLVSLGCVSVSSRLVPPATEQKFFTSAFVLELEGAWYLVTVGHALNWIKDYLDRNRHLRHQFVIFAGFGTYPMSRELFRFDYREPVFCVDRPEGLDFGAIRLDLTERSLLQGNGVWAVEQRYWDQDLPPQFSKFALLGLPVQNMELDTPGMAGLQAVFMRAEAISEVPDPWGHHTDPMRYFKVMEPAPADLEIEGMSGCPVFAFSEREGRDVQALCCGVQSAWLRQRRVLKASDLRFAGQALRDALRAGGPRD